MTCPHETTEPVETLAFVDGEPETVARICVDCLERLPASWGCRDCEWFEVKAHGGSWSQTRLGRPCPKHRKDVV